MDTLTFDRTAYREAVSTIAEKARTTLPLCNGRVDKAVKLVLGGDVALHADGTATVGSMSDASKSYAVAHSACDCQDFSRAPEGHPFQYRNCWTSSQEVDECLSFLSSTFFGSFSARPPTVWV